jgi:hypothetical protein
MPFADKLAASFVQEYFDAHRAISLYLGGTPQ